MTPGRSGQGRLTRGGRAACLAFGMLMLNTGTAAETVEVIIQKYRFIPADLKIKAGTTVRWVNREKRTSHSVVFSGPSGFESERLFPDESWEHRFDVPAQFQYVCGPHPEMKGSIEVTR